MGKDVIRLSIEKGIGEISHSFLALSPLAFFNTFFIIAGKILPHAEIKSFFSPFPFRPISEF